jgi:hypothetical protein
MKLLSHDAWTRHVRIPFGNLLGILLLCLMLVPIFIATAIFAHDDHPPLPYMIAMLGLMFFAPAAAAVIDILWRQNQPAVGKLSRLISPFEGGTIILFPAWLVSLAFIGLLLFTAARDLQRRISHHPPPPIVQPAHSS